jgi:hypothetical protein
MESAADFGFANPGAMQLPDFRNVYGHRGRPPQAFAILPGMRQAGCRAALKSRIFLVPAGGAVARPWSDRLGRL